jgi:hypothetical protein
MQLTPRDVFYLFVMFVAPQVYPRVTLLRVDPRATAPEGRNLGT